MSTIPTGDCDDITAPAGRPSAGERAFPSAFMWGTATAAHQIEGGNVNSDWWAFEHAPGTPCVEPSGDACDSWHRYKEDLDLVAGAGLGAYRFSVEWARVEPEEKEWSNASLDHYRRVAAGCLERGLVPVVTLNHFTLPRWFADLGGWEDAAATGRFARYCERVAEALGDMVGWFCTLNEPNIVAAMGYRFGIFPPGVADSSRRARVSAALVAAHRAGVEAIRSVTSPAEAALRRPMLGMTLSMTDYQALPGGEERMARIRQAMEDVFLEGTEGDDFVGVQTYSRARVSASGTLGPEEGVRVTQMGYEVWPEALGGTIRRAAEVTRGLPLLVTENGISTDDDSERRDFVAAALGSVADCIAEGIDVRGYFYWSLLDNFEWALGYGPKFGLVEVDRQSFTRRPKPSLAWLGSVARANGIVISR